jgi:hypothetical protein
MTERTNSNRAISAHVAATAYQNYTGSDNWALVTDLVCDLMHLANETGPDALEHVHLAILHWHSETYGGEPQPGGEWPTALQKAFDEIVRSAQTAAFEQLTLRAKQDEIARSTQQQPSNG